MQNIVIWLQINTANFLREWQISSFLVQAALLFVGFAIYFKMGISVPEIPDLRVYYYKLSRFFGFFSFSILLNIAGVYYSSNLQLSHMLKTLSIGIGLLIIVALIQNLNKLEIIKFNKNILYLLLGITGFVLILSLAPSNIIAPIISLPIWFAIPFIFFYISYQKEEKLRFQSFFLGLGFLLFFGGIIVIPNILDNLIPNIRYSSDSILSLYYNFLSIGMIYVGLVLVLYFGQVNYLKETKWLARINSIHVLRKNGEFIVYKDFKTDEISLKISDRQKMIKEIIESSIKSQKSLKFLLGNLIKLDRSMKIIEKEDKVYIFKEGIHVNALLITQEKGEFYENKLQKFVRDFELYYDEFLSKWTGNLDLFETSFALIDQYFPIGGVLE
ncbi:MAG: hypothetical protein HWN67_06440 [Candidatus Helarchaeota archaeon]|nr:hypothetical protein [Candidatus Helarchaeota archaeon]